MARSSSDSHLLSPISVLSLSQRRFSGWKRVRVGGMVVVNREEERAPLALITFEKKSDFQGSYTPSMPIVVQYSDKSGTEHVRNCHARSILAYVGTSELHYTTSYDMFS